MTLWTCPRCGRQFVNRNQPHSCGRYTVEAHLEGKSPHVVALYERLATLARACGPILLAPAKTRIGFQVRMIFAAVTLRQNELRAHVVLARRLENPRFTRIESLSPRSHVHHFRIHSLDELDDEVAAWLCEAYRWGRRNI